MSPERYNSGVFEMKSLFPGFYRPSSESLTKLLQEGLIVLDTNVILNLYRYPKSAREDLLRLLEATRDRLWIPHQVAHEYQRNRTLVISEQVKKFAQARSIAKKIEDSVNNEINSSQIIGRHSLIDPTELMGEIDSALNRFTTSLDELEKEQMTVNGEDEIRNFLDHLFEGHIGPSPSQEWLDSVYTRGAERYRNKRSPGWADKPEKEKLDDYWLFDLRFTPMYGDLIIWVQILDKIAHERPPGVIVVTDDTKPDWWSIVESQGKKNLGPNPHLVEEIEALAPNTPFYMYNSERFVKYANAALSVPIDDNSLFQIRAAQKNLHPVFVTGTVLHDAVHAWLIQELNSTVHAHKGFPDFIAGDGEDETGKILGFEVKAFRSNTKRMFFERLRMASVMASDSLHHGLIDELHLIVVLDHPEELDQLEPELSRRIADLEDVSTVTIGTVHFEESAYDYVFVPIEKFPKESYYLAY